MNKCVKTKELYDCRVPYLKELFDSCEYPWEMLPKIKEWILSLIEAGLPDFTELTPGVWVGRDVKIADYVTIHMPLLPFNTGIINRETIAKMKDGVIFLNTSRGQMVVEQDLADALNSGKVAAAGLDVVSTEPIRGDNPLLQAKNCFITPHMAWGAIESRQRIMDTTVVNIRGYQQGEPVNVVNP